MKPITKNLSVLKRPFFAIAFTSWMAFITFLSLTSFADVGTPAFNIPHLDKLVHLVFYFVAVVLGCLSLREYTRGAMALKSTLLRIILFTIIYGIIIEVIQGAVTVSRNADILDVLANSTGAFLGGLAINFIFSNKRGLKWNN